MLLFFAVDLLNGPLLELTRRNGTRAPCGRDSWEKERQCTSWRRMVIGRSDLEIDADEFQVRLESESVSMLSSTYCAF